MTYAFSLSSPSLPEIVPLSRLLCGDQSQHKADPSDLNVTVTICGQNFLVPTSVLRFISPFALSASANHSNVFAIDCPSDTLDVTPQQMTELFQRVLSMFESNETFTFEERDYCSMRYLFTELKSDSLIHSFNHSIERANGDTSKGIEFCFVPYSLFDDSRKFTFIIEGREFKCGALCAALICPRVKKQIERKSNYEMPIQIPGDIDKSLFLRTFSDFFSVLNGFSFPINDANVSVAKRIGDLLENQQLINFAFKVFSRRLEFKTPFHQLLFSVEYGASVGNDIIDSVASEFYQFLNEQNEQISRLPVAIISRILSSKSLKIRKEDDLFKALDALYTKNSGYSSLFEFVNFSNVSNENRIRFFELFDPSLLSSSLWRSLSSINKRPAISPDRYLYIVEKSFSLNSNGSNGLFSYFRSKHQNQNPHDAGVVRMRASSVSGSGFPKHVLEWDTQNSWTTLNEGCAWIDFDLLGKQFVFNGIAINIYGRNAPKRWVLQGSNGDEKFETIYESNNDTEFNIERDVIVPLPIECSKRFSRFRISANGCRWGASDYYFNLRSVEFYGQLFSLT
jgi:hypothetical protein